MPHKPIIKPNIKKDPKILIYKLTPLLPLWSMISNGYRTEWSPIRSVIIRVKSGSPICLITSMITDRIGRHEVLLPLLFDLTGQQAAITTLHGVIIVISDWLCVSTAYEINGQNILYTLV